MTLGQPLPLTEPITKAISKSTQSCEDSVSVDVPSTGVAAGGGPVLSPTRNAGGLCLPVLH